MNIKKFFNNVLVFFTGNVLSKLVALFLLPLYTSRLLPEQYGTYDIVISIVYLIAPLAFVQIWDAMFRFSFDSSNKNGKYKVINNSLAVSLAGAVIYSVLFLVIAQYFNAEYIGYALIYGFAYVLQYVYSYAARVFEKNKLFSITGIINTVVSAVCNIVLILVFNWDVKSLYVSQIIGVLVQVILIEFKIHVLKNVKIKDFDKTLIKQMVKFSIPLCVSTMSYWLLNSFTKIIINLKFGSYYNGLYLVVNRFSSVLIIVTTVFQYALNESTFAITDSGEKRNVFSVSIDVMIKSSIFISLILCFGLKLIFPYFIDEQYWEATALIPATIIGAGISSASGLLNSFYMAEKNTIVIFVTTFIAAILNCIIGWVLAPYIGTNGVLIVLAGAFTLLMLLRLIHLFVKIKLKFDFLNLLLLPIIAISVILFYKIDGALYLVLVALGLTLLFALSLLKYLKTFVKSKKVK